MIATEVKAFERSSRAEHSHTEAQRLLAQDIHHYIAFFKEKVVDYDISFSNYEGQDGIVFNAILILRHNKDSSGEAW